MSRPLLLLIEPVPVPADARAEPLRDAGFDVIESAGTEGVPAEVRPAAVLLRADASPSNERLEALHAFGVPVYLVTSSPAAAPPTFAGVLEDGPGLGAALVAALTPQPAAPLTPEALARAMSGVGAGAAVITCASGGQEGTIWLRNGRIVDATAGVLFGDRALHRIFTWDEGLFVVSAGLHDRTGPMSLDVGYAIQEARRRQEVRKRLVDGLAGVEAVYRVDFVALAQRLGEIPDTANTFLRLVDGRRSLRELLGSAPVDDLETLSVLLRLRIDGVIHREDTTPMEVTPVDTVTAPPLPPAPAVARPPPPPEGALAESGFEDSLPLVAAEAIGDALTWIAAPAGNTTAPPAGHIPVVHFPSERGTRRLRLEQASLDARVQASARHERPRLLIDEVRPPGITTGELREETPAVPITDLSPRSRAEPSRVPVAGILIVIGLASAAVAGVWWTSRPAQAPSEQAPLAAGQEPENVAPLPAPAPQPALAAAPDPPPSAPEPATATAPAPPPPPAAMESASHPPVTPAPPPPAPAVADTATPPTIGSPVPASPAPTPAIAGESYADLLKAGADANARGKPGRAIPLLERALTKQKTAAAYLELGRAYYSTDRLSKALDCFQKSTALDAKAPAAWRELGMALQDSKRTEDAKAAYKHFLEVEPAGSRHHSEIQSVLEHLSGG